MREAHVYSEIVPHTMPVAEMLAKDPAAIILSGGPSSVYAAGRPAGRPALFDADVPVFGICYGFQAMAQALGGTVAPHRQPRVRRHAAAPAPRPGCCCADLPAEQPVWMSHGDCVTEAPAGFTVTAESAGAPVAAFEDLGRRLAGVQFHPEVGHTEHGQEMLDAASSTTSPASSRPGRPANIIEEQVAAIRARVGDKQVICGLSGGVDSAVAAALVHKAVGDQLTCVFVDHGLLRAGEAEQVEKDYVAATGIKLKVVDAPDRFLGALAGVTDPEQKRKIIGREFIRVFEAAAREVAAHGRRRVPGAGHPLPGRGRVRRRHRHRQHQVPPQRRRPPRRPAVRARRAAADALQGRGTRARRRSSGLPEEIVWRHPFPGPGLAIRIIGAVDQERLDLLRAADLIAREELTAAGLDRDVWQFPVVLLADVRSVGVQGDGRTYGHPVVLRPVSSEDAMTADWSRLPVRPARPDLHPDHQRGARGQPGRPGRDQQAAGHHRVGVTVPVGCAH